MSSTSQRPNHPLRHVLVMLILAGEYLAVSHAAQAADAPADRFVAALQSDASIPGEARNLIQESWSKCVDCDGGEFLTQGLVLLSKGFREGLEAYEADEYNRSAQVLGQLREDPSRFVATNAQVFEIKALVAAERFAEASERIAALTADGGADLSAYTYHRAEVSFLRGFCLLADLQYESAAEALAAFLQEETDAPQRLLLSAQQMLGELENRQPGRIGEVVDLMSFSGRRLKSGDTGEKVQTRQQRILELLDNLIQEAEQSEQSSQQSSSNSRGGSRSQSPQRPMPESRLPGGGSAEESLRSARRANPGEMWGAMPPAERERILQSLRDSFPSRYRQLVEQYYEELARKP